MGDQGAVAGDHGVGLRADAGLLTQERARRPKFGIQEAEATRFIPLGVVRVGLAGGGEELTDGLVVEGAVLADVQHGHVEAEGAQEAEQRIKFRAGDAAGADLDQGLAEEQQVGDDALGRAVLAWAQFAFGVGQAEAREVDILAPGLADVTLEGFLARFAMRGGVLGDLTREHCRRLLEVIAKRKALAEGLEALVTDCDRGRAEKIQRTGGDIGRDQRVAVTVAADPGTEGDLGQ